MAEVYTPVDEQEEKRLARLLDVEPNQVMAFIEVFRDRPAVSESELRNGFGLLSDSLMRLETAGVIAEAGNPQFNSFLDSIQARLHNIMQGTSQESQADVDASVATMKAKMKENPQRWYSLTPKYRSWL